MNQMTIEPKTPTTSGHTSAAPAAAPVAAPAPAAVKAPARSLRPRVVIAAGLLVAGLAGFGVWKRFLAAPGTPPASSP